MKKDEPLIMRLHFSIHMYELVRLIGYEGVSEAELRETIKPLVQEYQMGRMSTAAHELTQTDEKTRLVTLRPNVRKIVFGILGPPPERADYASYWASQGVLPPNQRPKAEPPKVAEPVEPTKEPEKPKRSRKKVEK